MNTSSYTNVCPRNLGLIKKFEFSDAIIKCVLKSNLFDSLSESYKNTRIMWFLILRLCSSSVEESNLFFKIIGAAAIASIYLSESSMIAYGDEIIEVEPVIDYSIANKTAQFIFEESTWVENLGSLSHWTPFTVRHLLWVSDTTISSSRWIFCHAPARSSLTLIFSGKYNHSP